MLKLFIVDDEPDTREGLRYYFDWAKYGIEVIGEADDGSSALGPILKEKPDIVLSDVRMPDMDGIDMAKHIREANENIKIIFVSGYDDVGYIKSALKVEAIDYILKPVDLKELDEVVSKVVKLINEEKEARNLICEMNSKLLQSMPSLREKFFMTLVRDGINNEKDIEKKIDFLELELPNGDEYCILVISIDDKASVFDNLSEKDKQLTSFSIINICEELIQRSNGGYTFENRPAEYVCILRLRCHEDEDNICYEDKENLYSLISGIKDSLLGYLKISVTIGVGLTVVGLENVFKSYSKAYDNVNQKLFLGKNKIISMDSLEVEEDYIHKFDFSNAEQLVNLIKSSDEEKLISAIDDIFKDIARYKYANTKYCLNICLQLILTASRQLMEMQINIEDAKLNDNKVWEQLFKLETLEDMKTLIINYLLTISRYIAEKRNKKSRNVIQAIKEVIHKKYNENISVNEIAKEVYLSATYLCVVFKQETGETVNDYITKVRIERAKELLKDPRNKLYDICHGIGYTEPGYFSKIFKKHTGLSPTEYRENLI
jgi:two-component system, response regulator YesN